MTTKPKIAAATLLLAAIALPALAANQDSEAALASVTRQQAAMPAGASMWDMHAAMHGVPAALRDFQLEGRW
jgi:crotonobetainyl-CoA:carnitine CoA-transferase CaiB-like acyl-CoA transferase